MIIITKSLSASNYALFSSSIFTGFFCVVFND